jgi:hypothetical protein
MWETPLRLGRVVGLLLLAQFIVALLVNVVLFGPVISQPPGWIVNAAARPLTVSLSVVLALVADAIWLAIAVLVYPLFAHVRLRTAVAFVALTSIALALSAVEHSHVMSMLSLSQANRAGGAADPELFETLRQVVGSGRNWAHYTHLMVTGCSILAFFLALHRFSLVPRVLAIFGMATAALQIVIVTRPIFGQPVVFPLLLPLGLAILSLVAWLLARGFATSRRQDPGAMTGDEVESRELRTRR